MSFGDTTRRHILNPLRKASFQFYSHLDWNDRKFVNNLYLFFQPIPVLLPSTSVRSKFWHIHPVLSQVEYFQRMIQGLHWPILSKSSAWKRTGWRCSNLFFTEVDGRRVGIGWKKRYKLFTNFRLLESRCGWNWNDAFRIGFKICSWGVLPKNIRYWNFIRK